MSILAGIGEIKDGKVVVKRKRSPYGKRKAVLDAEGNEVAVEKKPRAPKKQKKAKEKAVHDSPPAAAAPAAAHADADAANYDPGVTARYDPQAPSIQGYLSGRGRGTVSPISPILGLTQIDWPKERKDDPPPKQQYVYHSKTCKNVTVLLYGPPDLLGVSKTNK